MQHPLQQKVEQIRRAAFVVRLLHAIGWLLAAGLAAGLILGLFDFVLRSEEFGVRLLYSAAALGAIGWTIWRFLMPALRSDAGIVQVAQRIERRWPHLQDRLSSSLEFLGQTKDDPADGSPALRRTVVAQATAQIDGLPLREVVNRRRPVPVLITAGVLLLVVGLLSLAAPETAARAARRLAMPWSTDEDDAWPRRHELVFIDPPAAVPYGEPFRAELKDNIRRPPELVEIYYQFEGQERADVQPQTMKPAGERMVHQLSRVTRPFKYWAVGGDDETSEHSVEVVEPPRVESLNISLHPPEYTGYSPHESSRNIRAIAGTAVSISGTSTKPLAAARIAVETADGERDIPLEIDADRRSFKLPADGATPWVLAEPGAYRLILAGDDGVESGRHDRFQLDVSPDAPPRISVESPEANTFVTPSASVPIEAAVSDDLAIARIELRYTRSDASDAGEQVVVLYEGPPQATVDGQSPVGAAGDTRHVKTTWDLAGLAELPAGASLLMSIAASDYRPQEEQSTPRRITIITADQLEDRIVQQQTFLLGQLAEALSIQREARSQTKALQIQIAETSELAPDDVVDLQSAELNQRRVERLLAGEHDGVLAQIDALLDLARRNRLDNPDLQRRIGDLGKAVRRITTQQLPAIQRDLLTALKAGQTAMHAADDEPVAGAPVGEVRRSVDAAGTVQEEVIERLEKLLGNLSQWDSYRRFARQVSGLRRDQEAISEQTGQMRPRTLSKSVQQLSAQDRADLAKLSQRQTELARRLERMLTNMEQMRGGLANDPLAEQTLGDAVEFARSSGLSGQMRQASRQIEENQLGQASQQQQQLSEQLDELLDTLTGRREHQLQRQLEKLNEAAAELKGLRDKADELAGETVAAMQNPNVAERRRRLERLEAQRQQQQEQIERLARKLERLQAEQAAQSLAQAAEHTRRSGEAAAQGDGASQRQEDDLADEQLARAEAQIQQRIAQIERDLLDEQLARLEQSLQGMVDQQQTIHNGTARLDNLQQKSGSLTRGQLASVRTLAQQQRGLMSETGDFAEQIAAAEVFHLGLTGALREMSVAADRLEAVQTDETTQQAEAAALRRLEQLVLAMREDAADEPAETAAGADSGGNQNQPADGIRNVAQLKLLKLMQQSVQERTNHLEQARTTRDWTERERRELVELAQEQGRLAELLLKLFQPADDNSQASPDTLPDLDDDLGNQFDQELQDVLDQFKTPE